jgi:hypothetical protein
MTGSRPERQREGAEDSEGDEENVDGEREREREGRASEGQERERVREERRGETRATIDWVPP